MKKIYPGIQLLTGILLLLGFYACNNAAQQKPGAGVTSSAAEEDTVQQNEVFPAWEDSLADQKAGIIGIYEVPEMLSLCKMDSAHMKDVSQRIIDNFSALEKDVNQIGSALDAYQGIIYYNNDPANFKFECFLLIKKMPKKEPKHSTIVMLESGKMLVYNHYGPYDQAFKAYQEIKQYCTDNKLVQIGPMREYYPIIQSTEQDPAKRLTRMMLPVVREKKGKK